MHVVTTADTLQTEATNHKCAVSSRYVKKVQTSQLCGMVLWIVVVWVNAIQCYRIAAPSRLLRAASAPG